MVKFKVYWIQNKTYEFSTKYLLIYIVFMAAFFVKGFLIF